MTFEHSEECEFFGGTLVRCKCYQPLKLAKDLIAGLDERNQAKLAKGEISSLNTELNEIRRILHYLADAIERIG